MGLLPKPKVLFVCIHNSARSQMAEEILRKCAGGQFEAESAGIEPGTLNPLAVEVLKEIGIDIAAKQTRKAADLMAQGRQYDYVITVCGEGNAARCPSFPGGKKLHWAFPDPSTFTGTWEEKLNQTRAVRDQIQKTIQQWLRTV